MTRVDSVPSSRADKIASIVRIVELLVDDPTESGSDSRISLNPDFDEGAPMAVSVGDAAKILGISRALAYELVARNEIPSIRLGRRLVVPRRALIDLLSATR